MTDFYGTADTFRTFHTDRGTDVSNYPNDGDIENALLIASEWLDGTYRSRFHGYKVGQRDQQREWPRTGATDRYGYAVSSETVPVEITNATFEAAIRELQTPGALLTDYTQSVYKRVAISGSISVEYRDRNANEVQLEIPAVDHALEPLIGGAFEESVLSSRTTRA